MKQLPGTVDVLRRCMKKQARGNFESIRADLSRFARQL